MAKKKPEPPKKPSKNFQGQSRWWKLEGPELATEVCSTVDALEKADEYRRAIYKNALSLYEGRPVSLDETGYYSAATFADRLMQAPLYNLTRSACDSVKADIAGRQKPKPMFITTGGDWRARRRAKKLDKFVEAQLSQRQGGYANTWQLMEEVFHDSAKLGIGVAKVSPNVQHGRVDVTRVFPWELFVDPKEARNRNPQNIFHRYTMEVDIAIEAFVEMNDDGEPVDDAARKMKLAIETAKPPPSSDFARVVKSIVIREAWRLPFSEDKPGKHVICTDSTVLFEEDWDEPEFPFIILWWEHDTIGFWGSGIAAEGAGQDIATNRAARKLQDRIEICSTLRTYMESGMAKMEDMEAGGAPENIIIVQDINRIPVTPPPQPATQAEFEWVELNIQRYFAMRGVSQMTASAQKPEGVDAAVAMQTLDDIATVRFLPKARGYEESFCTGGRLMVRAAAKVAERSGGYLIRWPGKAFLQELNWNEVKIENDMYDIRVAPISMFSRDPAAMLQIAQDLHEGGIINRETFLQMTALPDLEGMMNRETAEREYLEELFSRYLDAEDDEDLLKLGGYEAPEGFMTNKPAAMWLAVSTYWMAKREHAPIFNLDLIQRWIGQLEKLLAPPPASAAAPGMGAPMPGPAAPPMGLAEAPGALPAGVQGALAA